MTVQEAINKLIKWAEAQVGYEAKSNKWNKYAEYIDKYPDFYNTKKQNVDWCDVWYDVGICQCFTVEIGRQMLYQPKKSTGAGCGYSAGFYRKNNAWSKTPQRGAQIFYAPYGNESHTGIVIDFDSTYVYTIEGNTGGGNGKVTKKKVLRNANISGYGIPNWKLASKVKDEDKKEEKKKFTTQYGIDISQYQGNFDMARAKREGVQFVIIRGGINGSNGIERDARFEENYKKAKQNNLPVGIYWFSNARSNAEATREAEFFYEKCLKGKQYELPVYIDVEGGMLNQNKRTLTNAILTWLKYIRKKGYWVGIYSGTSALLNSMYDDELRAYAHWVADWRGKCYYPYYHGMWQFKGGSGKVAGVPCDQNYMYEDYETEIKAKGLNGWDKTPQPTPQPTPEPKTFKVRVSINDLRIRAGAGTNTAIKGFIPKGTYTITETKKSGGYTWGKLSNGQGWIALDYTTIL